VNFYIFTYHSEMKCPITGKNCLKHKSMESDGKLVCGDCLYKTPEPVKTVGELTCSSCGMSLVEIVKGSRFGCPSCYDNFQDVQHIVGSVQLGTSDIRHTGRVPSRFLEEKSKLVSREEILEEISMRMNSASSKGDYEEAARMKSKMLELESIEKDGRADYDVRLARFVEKFWREISKGFY